jgi:hypothetical protein
MLSKEAMCYNLRSHASLILAVGLNVLSGWILDSRVPGGLGNGTENSTILGGMDASSGL